MEVDTPTLTVTRGETSDSGVFHGQRFDRRTDAMGHQGRALRIRPRHHDRKLPTSVACHEVTGPLDNPLERAPNPGQAFVAGLMPQPVVVVAEIVDVDQ